MEVNNEFIPKNFTSYTSSSRECRIGGMREFYEAHNIKDGDELVVKLIDEQKYRIFPSQLARQRLHNVESQNELFEETN